jgi:hypothetical protein
MKAPLREYPNGQKMANIAKWVMEKTLAILAMLATLAILPPTAWSKTVQSIEDADAKKVEN